MNPRETTMRHAHTITVGPEAIDQLGHANNIEYVRWVQDIAAAHSVHSGLTFEVYRELGACFVVRRHEIDYLRPVFEGDVLTVETWVESFTRVTAERATTITNQKGELVAKGMTTWVYVSLDTFRPVRIHPEVRARFGAPE